MLFRRRSRADDAAPITGDVEGQPGAGDDPHLTAIATLSNALVRARDKEAVARTLIDACRALLHVEFAAVALVAEDGAHAEGLLAVADDSDVGWWEEVSLDFEREPSGIGSAVFDGAPVVVYDCAASSRVNPQLVERVGAKSAVFVPLVSQERGP